MAHPSVSVGVQLFLVDGVWWWCVVLALPHFCMLPNPNCQLFVGYVMVHVVFR